jgi:hypothetical protein
VRYIAATIAAYRYIQAPGNADRVCGLLGEDAGLPKHRIREAYQQITDPERGFTPDARILLDGMQTLLNIRAAFNGLPAPVHPASDYVDDAYYNKALQALA